MLNIIVMKSFKLIMFCLLFAGCQSSEKKETAKKSFIGQPGEVKLIVLAPGHFHADLLQKNKVNEINDSVYVYAQQGKEIDQYLSRIQAYNNRNENPTQWNEVVYKGEDFLNKMISDKNGNVVVLAGNNKEKTKYILESINAGLNVLSDKPMAINKENFELLKQAYDSAQAHHVMLYDMMTERYDILNIVEQKLINNKDVFGELREGNDDEPAISMESVHHFYKEVSGKPLIRPAWYYDVEQQGEGIADVTTHYIDLVNWKCFPEESLDYKKDINILSAEHWATDLSLEDYSRSTKMDSFPDYLKKYVEDSKLKVFANGTINYRVKGVNIALKVIWNYKAPEGGGDTFSAYIKGSKASLKTVQDSSSNFVKQLYIERVKSVDKDKFEAALEQAAQEIQKDYPLVKIKPSSSEKRKYLVDIPAQAREGHESHFGHVAQEFFDYLIEGKMPQWEISNTLAKYYITTSALELAKKNK